MFRASWTLLFSCKYLLQIRTNGVYQMPLGFILQTPFKKKRGNRVAGMDTALYTHILLTLNKWNKEVVITSLPWRGKSVFLQKKKLPGGVSSQLVRVGCQPLVCLFSRLKNSSGWKSQTKKKQKTSFVTLFRPENCCFWFWLVAFAWKKSESMRGFGKVHRHHSPTVGYSPRVFRVGIDSSTALNIYDF